MRTPRTAAELWIQEQLKNPEYRDIYENVRRKIEQDEVREYAALYQLPLEDL